MRPAFLHTIARAFPKLRIQVAHLGNPWYDEAAEGREERLAPSRRYPLCQMNFLIPRPEPVLPVVEAQVLSETVDLVIPTIEVRR